MDMWDTSGRLLRLLSLLQRQREWNANELAEELSVTARTVRRDIARLRELGYPVATSYGTGGGYQLEAGAVLPPLMFDADEAVSTVLALRSLAVDGRGGRDRSNGSLITALDKLTRVMPARLRSTIAALTDHSSEVDLGVLIGPPRPAVDLKSLITLSRARREERQVLCVYTRGDIRESRRLEPLHLVKALGSWYLIAYCLNRMAWRTFRVDRLDEFEITSIPSTRRTPPAVDLDGYVRESISHGYRQVTATVRIHAAKERIEQVILPAWGTVTRETTTTALAEVGAENYDVIARWLLLTDAPITVLEPRELTVAFERLTEHCRRIATGDYSLLTGGSEATNG